MMTFSSRTLHVSCIYFALVRLQFLQRIFSQSEIITSVLDSSINRWHSYQNSLFRKGGLGWLVMLWNQDTLMKS